MIRQNIIYSNGEASDELQDLLTWDLKKSIRQQLGLFPMSAWGVQEILKINDRLIQSDKPWDPLCQMIVEYTAADKYPCF